MTKLISTEEAAAALSVTPYTVREWARQRRFPVVRLSKTRMAIKEADLEAFIKNQTRGMK
jgi:excisionase family DNA binding protein